MRYCMQKKLFIGPTLQQEIKIYQHKFGDSSAYIFIYIFPILGVILSLAKDPETFTSALRKFIAIACIPIRMTQMKE